MPLQSCIMEISRGWFSVLPKFPKFIAEGVFKREFPKSSLVSVLLSLFEIKTYHLLLFFMAFTPEGHARFPGFPRLSPVGGLIKSLPKTNLVMVAFSAFTVNPYQFPCSLKMCRSTGYARLPMLPQFVATGDGLDNVDPKSTFNILAPVV